MILTSSLALALLVSKARCLFLSVSMTNKLAER